jgi:hypothetical protein
LYRAVALDTEACPYCNAPLNSSKGGGPDTPGASRKDARTLTPRHSGRTTVQDSTESYPSVLQHCVRERAYEIYERGGARVVMPSDWLTVEAELKELKKKAADLVVAVEALTV